MSQLWKQIRRRKTEFKDPAEGHLLHRVLNVRDLTMFGIAAIIGGGVFSSIGKACFEGGPAVVILFIICAIACGFAAVCYAEFASRIPVSGSAYTYAYASFGELFAWIIGWALLMEYAIGNIYIAFAWSGYFTNLLQNLGTEIPAWISTNYKSASAAWQAFNASGEYNAEALKAWQSAPMIGNFHVIFDLPALCINLIITALVFVGVKESRIASNFMVMLKILVVVIIICVGVFYVQAENLVPFMPTGFSGVMTGVSAVFFTYIGFDAVSTMAEESKNPQRDLPRGMFYSLIICTVLYVLISFVLTGMVNYKLLNVADPLAHVLELRGIKWLEYFVSISAVVAMTSVMLVFQMGQPRIWLSMARDGLMPKKFAYIHPRFKTPSYATIITGLVVGIPILFLDEDFVLDFTSIGTMFAFVLVCGGVLLLPKKEKIKGRFNMPFIPAQYIFPCIVAGSAILCLILFPTYFPSLLGIEASKPYDPPEKIFVVSNIIFWLANVVLAFFAWRKRLSLIPLLGVTTCLYLLTGMKASNWLWFVIWFAFGLVIYFLYGYRKSKLAP